MSVQVAHQLNLETEDCCQCGIVFAMPASMRARLRVDGGNFYCPNGHSQHYTKPEIERVRELLDAANRRNTDLADRAIRAEAAELKSAKEKKLLQRRIEKGVCPCCNRTFQNLQRHMSTKHPEFP